MDNEPGAAVIAILDRLIDRIKSNVPQRTDGKPLESGFVYSQLVLGELVDPNDYHGPWSPMGGATLQDLSSKGQLPPVGPPPPAAAPAAGTTPATGAAPAAAPAPAATPTPDPKYARAMEAAFKTAQLVDRMIMLTKDGTFREYPGGERKISFAYEGIINGMQAPAPPPIAPDVQKELDAATKLLNELDDDGNIVGKSKLNKTYTKNARAYAKAKMDYADAQAAALADPIKANTWPQDSTFYQQQVDDGWDTLKSEGAEKIERALDIIESVGVSMQDRMIAKARKVYDAWNLGLAGVPVTVPYSYISPSSWCDPDADDDGWAHLTVESSEYQNHTGSNMQYFRQSSTHSDASSTSASGGASFMGFGASGGGSTSATNKNAANSSGGDTQITFHNDAKNLKIDLEYGLIDINRPWLIGDLFYMKNWYLVSNAKNGISDGTINGQADSDKTLLPMIPTQFLVVRNLTISTKQWGQDGKTLSKFFSSDASDSSTRSVEGHGGASVGFGPFSFNATASHAQNRADSHASGKATSEQRGDFEAQFDGETLTIKGAQIMAWLSTIVPACAPLDDPGLKKQ